MPLFALGRADNTLPGALRENAERIAGPLCQWKASYFIENIAARTVPSYDLGRARQRPRQTILLDRAARLESVMKIATYNVNSIRQRLPLVLDWLAEHRPDVMCLQETKVQDHEFPAMAIRAAGYHANYRGMKGYNGVATLTRSEPEKVLHGLHEGPDNEDFRIIQTVVSGVAIINSYVPLGHSITSEKYAFKLEWFRRLREYFETALDPMKPGIWLGDLNVAPEPIDVYHPEKRVHDVDFHIDARNAYKQTRDWGFVDVFRKLHPDTIQYTYWDYYRNALERNFGWRIDHILATEPLAEHCIHAAVDMAPRRAKAASDHTVVWAEFDI